MRGGENGICYVTLFTMLSFVQLYNKQDLENNVT
jgi:hypothetical protein